MSSTEPREQKEIVSDTTVHAANGALTFTFREDGVLVRLPCDAVLVSWNDWEFIARVYGKRGNR